MSISYKENPCDRGGFPKQKEASLSPEPESCQIVFSNSQFEKVFNTKQNYTCLYKSPSPTHMEKGY